MPEMYDGIESDDETTITRQCSPNAGCGEEFEVTVQPDGTYDDTVRYIGTIEFGTDDAELVTQRWVEDDWVDGKLPEFEWSETQTREVWLHEDCIGDDADDLDHVPQT